MTHKTTNLILATKRIERRTAEAEKKSLAESKLKTFYGIKDLNSFSPEELLEKLDNGSITGKHQDVLIKLFPSQFNYLIANKIISASCWNT